MAPPLNIVASAWSHLAIALFPIQLRVTAPYGRHARTDWDPSIPNRLGWSIMEPVSRCIDEKASRIHLWTHEDRVPHKVGQYLSVRDLRIDKTKVGSAQVLRCEGWTGPLIVSGEIKDALERMGATGTKFEEL